jgi:hypothetical protein
LRQQSAELTTGTGQGAGAPFTMAEYEKAIGTNSLQQIAKGMTDMNQMIQTTPTGPAFNPSTMLVTPGQEQEAAQQASVMNAAPNPQAAAEANLLAQQQAAQMAQVAANSGGTAGTAGTGGYRITGSQGGTGAGAGLTTGANTAAQTGTGVYGATGIAGQTGLGGGLGVGLGGGAANTWIPMGNGLQYNPKTGAVMPVGSGVLGGGTNPTDVNPYAGLGVGYDPTTGTFSGGTGTSGYDPYSDPYFQDVLGLEYSGASGGTAGFYAGPKTGVDIAGSSPVSNAGGHWEVDLDTGDFYWVPG